MALLVLFTLLDSAATLQQRFEQIAAQAGGRVGAAAMLLETGESATLNGTQKFPMQSVYKLPICVTVLDRVDHHAIALGKRLAVRKQDMVPAGVHSPIRDRHPEGTRLTVEELVRFAMVESDGTASDVLLQLAGGPESVTAFLAASSLPDIIVATSEAAMGKSESVQYRNSASPEALVRLLRAIHNGTVLSAASRELLHHCMTETETGPHRLKGLLPAGTQVAHKTGTSATTEGLTRATNDVGIVSLPSGQHIAIAVFVADSSASQEIRESVIANIARAAWDNWAGTDLKKRK
jgi:beta-lactamase class A